MKSITCITSRMTYLNVHISLELSIAFSFQQEFPNFQVDVYATVLDNGGSALAAAIMAASLALANAGVPMFGLVTAATVVSKHL